MAQISLANAVIHELRSVAGQLHLMGIRGDAEALSRAADILSRSEIKKFITAMSVKNNIQP
jgi:hypothetical protein